MQVSGVTEGESVVDEDTGEDTPVEFTVMDPRERRLTRAERIKLDELELQNNQLQEDIVKMRKAISDGGDRSFQELYRISSFLRLPSVGTGLQPFTLALP